MIEERTPSLLYQYSIFCPDQKGLTVSRLVLNTQGFDQTGISETVENGRWSLRVYPPDKKRIENLNRIFSQLKLPGLKISTKTLKPKDWVDRWKTQWKPLSLTKRIDVIPYSYKARYKTSKQTILLDTLMSFGTGMHETTQLIAQLIEDKRGHLSSFLDIGTGTGILALVALKNGASSVTAMDISPLSIKAARSNIKANGLKAKLILSDIGRLPAQIKYQMVAANLVTNDLLQHRRKILNSVKPGGLLMVSGISLDNLKRFKEGFKDLPLTLRKVSKGKLWAALLYAKKM